MNAYFSSATEKSFCGKNGRLRFRGGRDNVRTEKFRRKEETKARNNERE
jgi:hypothetical protein